MSDLIKAKATICIVNYKTLELIRLCLRSIRKFTHYPYEVLVIDNNSKDESLDYLRTLNWIRLIERDTQNDHGGGHSHAVALELGLEKCNTEFFISMHSDTIVQKENWLRDLIGYFENNEKIACVGSDKIELTPKWRQLLKKTTDFKTFKRKLLKTPDPLGKYRYYNRTLCCIYRTGILKTEDLSFLAERDKGLTAGKKLYFDLVDRGYKTVELPAAVMGQYIIHLAHATQVINIDEFTLRRRTIRKANRLIRKITASELTQTLLADNSLDQ